MTSRFRAIRRLALPITMLATTAALAAPSSAMALLAGIESNGEIANSNRTPAQREAALDKAKAQGAKVIRVNWAWNEIATGDCVGQALDALKFPDNPCYDWSRLDHLVTESKERNQQILISMTRVPQWVVASPVLPQGVQPGHYMGANQTQFNRIIDHYAAFLAAAGTRYRTGSSIGTIPYWTIWNEPNSRNFWYPQPNADRYAQMYGKAAVALKKAHPAAKVAAGPTGPQSTIKPVPFIRAFVKAAPRYLPGTMSTKRRYLNAWAHNPYPGTITPPSTGQGRDDVNKIGMAKIDRLFTELDKAPLTKGTRVWATEFGWETKPERSKWVSDALQAQFLAESFDWLDSKRRVDIGIWYGLTDPIEQGDFQTGTYRANGAIKPSMRMYQRPISILQAGQANRVKRGTVVKVWGRSHLAPTKGTLSYRVPGKICPGRNPQRLQWCAVPGQKRRASDGSITAMMRLTAPRIEFKVYDGTVAFNKDTGYGPARAIRTF